MRIAITGGGIGGLSLALALHDTGRDDVTVYESAPAMRELGVASTSCRTRCASLQSLASSTN